MINERELLEKEVAPDSVFKTFIVNYVGSQLLPEDGRITVEMIVEVLAKEFPELVLVLAEENFIRGLTELVLQQETRGNFVSSIMCPNKYKKCPCLS